MLISIFSRATLTLAVLTPAFIITYLLAFGGATLRFHHHLYHEVAILIAVATSSFIGWVAHQNYRKTGETYQHWVALAYFAFAIIYTPHGILTRFSDMHLPAFLIFGPASRLAMALYLLIAIMRFEKQAAHNLRMWPHMIGFLAVSTALAGLGFAGLINIPQVRTVEMTSNVVFSFTVLAMLVKWRSEHLLNYHLAALLWFIQASTAFLLSKPWTHMWWLAHLVSAAGFMILGYAIMRARQTTGAFSQVFSSEQLHRRLKEHAAKLELEKQEQAKLIEKLHIASTHLTRSNRDLEQFASRVSHDLQAPLLTISGFSDIIKTNGKGKLDKDTDTALEYIQDGVRRMQSLIEGLLAFSRSMQQTQRLEPVNLNTLLGETIKDLHQSIATTRAKIVFEDLPTVECNPVQLRSVFQNLLTNAIKFCGDTPPEIFISWQRNQDHWKLSIRDNGIGIAPADVNTIFAMFHRLHSHQAYAGSGIGLATVERIIEGHGGRIWVESPGEGKGSCFHFTLPIVSSEAGRLAGNQNDQSFEPQNLEISGRAL